jgi:hypothetical protein
MFIVLPSHLTHTNSSRLPSLFWQQLHCIVVVVGGEGMVGMVLVAVALALQIHVVVEVVCRLLLVPGEGGKQVLLQALTL